MIKSKILSKFYGPVVRNIVSHIPSLGLLLVESSMFARSYKDMLNTVVQHNPCQQKQSFAINENIFGIKLLLYNS